MIKPSGDDYAITREELLRIRGEGFGPTTPTRNKVDQVRHGYKAAYEDGCRCTACRAAERSRARKRVASARHVSGRGGTLTPDN